MRQTTGLSIDGLRVLYDDAEARPSIIVEAAQNVSIVNVLEVQRGGGLTYDIGLRSTPRAEVVAPGLAIKTLWSAAMALPPPPPPPQPQPQPQLRPNRTLFVFHTESYNSSGRLNESVWRDRYPWSHIHTILLYSPHPELAAYARSVGANVAVSAGAPHDLSNATSRKEIISTSIANCRSAAGGCNAINLDVERKMTNRSTTSRQLTDFVAELAAAIKQSGHDWQLIFDAAAAPGYEGRWYDYGELSKAGVNFFFAMDYDLNDFNDLPPWNDHSLANAPAATVEQGLRELLEVIPVEKLVMGLPFYGYAYTDFVGRFPIVSSQLGLNDVFALLGNTTHSSSSSKSRSRRKSRSSARDGDESAGGWEYYWDNHSQTPFAEMTGGGTKKKKQIWYEDPRSIAVKASIARKLGLVFSGCWTGDALDYKPDAPFKPSDYWHALEL